MAYFKAGKSENTPTILEKRIWKPFVLNLTLVVVLFAVGLLVGLLVRSNEAADTYVLARGRSHFATIVMTRRWNAEHGGVYVEKTPGVVSNPYLKNPDVTAVDGRVFTKKNPALMTREISEIALRGEDLRFHITSLKPLNPDNAPDDFERESLLLFESGLKESTTRLVRDGKTFFRYMAPLMTEKPCLDCHAGQGYKVGDVRGGVSITYDITDVEKSTRMVMYTMVAIVTLLTTAVLGIIYIFVVKLMRALTEAHEKINELATIDGLTGVLNRRTFMDGCQVEFSRARRHDRSLCVIMIDLDHFKRVNDESGHQAGDEVLRAVGGLLWSARRTNDLAGRYGGEEFCLLLPETDLAGGVSKAEKIRTQVEALAVETASGKAIVMTASLGVAALEPGDSDFEALLARADKALYLAKARGRNSVVPAEKL